MKLTRTDYIMFFLTFFAYPATIYLWIGYRMLLVLNRILDNDAANRFGFGVYCSFSLMAIYWLVNLK